jgi:hypothetical protein
MPAPGAASSANDNLPICATAVWPIITRSDLRVAAEPLATPNPYSAGYMAGHCVAQRQNPGSGMGCAWAEIPAAGRRAAVVSCAGITAGR